MKIIKQKGVSLLEVLISVLILSIGVLGLGGLQLFALQGSNDAHFRTSASFIAEDLSDRIRINKAGAALAAYAITKQESANLCSGKSQQCLGSVPCPPEELATFDLYQVFCGTSSDRKTGAKYVLPSATLEVSCADTCDENSEHNITIGWVAKISEDQAGKSKSLSWAVKP